MTVGCEGPPTSFQAGGQRVQSEFEFLEVAERQVEEEDEGKEKVYVVWEVRPVVEEETVAARVMVQVVVVAVALRVHGHHYRF